jgi:hypothetical protein
MTKALVPQQSGDLVAADISTATSGLAQVGPFVGKQHEMCYLNFACIFRKYMIYCICQAIGKRALVK